MPAPVRKQIQPFVNRQSLIDLNNIGAQLDQAQLWWASGYFAGLAAGDTLPAATQPGKKSGQAPAGFTILYATETGNARQLAEVLCERAGAAGLVTRLGDLRDYKPSALKKEQNLLLIVSTHGLGEAPDGTEAFFDYLLSDRAPGLEHLNYSVLALGDSSYEDFCAMGKIVDERLAELGGTRLHTRVDCDLDYEHDAQRWTETVVVQAKEIVCTDEQLAVAVPQLHAITSLQYTRQHPFDAEVLVNQKITGRDSSKDVRHIELSLDGANINYLPGDALGVIPQNPPGLVEQFLQWLGEDGDTLVRLDNQELPLGEVLGKRLEITRLSAGFLKKYAATTGDPRIARLLGDENRQTLRRYLHEYQPLDVLNELHRKVSAQVLTDTLQKLTPRLYSIASSPDANPDEAHLAVAVVRYQAFGAQHWGSASNFLAGDTSSVPIYIQVNDHFRLPDDAATNVIMIGAGTGVAPFRAFVEHRQLHGAGGKNWLIYGDRNFSADFLYQLEWQRYLRQELLARLDLAFSRDQAEKIYVQQRIRERGRELYEWLENGAHLYLCGDALRMAPGVHQALIDVVSEQRGIDPDRAEDYLRELKRNGRYQRDIY